MRRHLSLLGCTAAALWLLCGSHTGAGQPAAGKSFFQKLSYEKALAKAKTSKKLVMLDFGAAF